MTLSRALIASLLCGIITALLIIVFALLYRSSTDFEQIKAVGPIAISIGIPIIMAVAGIIYFLLVHHVSKGELIYLLFFSILTIAGILFEMNPKSPTGETLLTLPHGFLFGIIAITGVAVCILLPYLAHHPKLYLTSDQMKWEK